VVVVNQKINRFEIKIIKFTWLAQVLCVGVSVAHVWLCYQSTPEQFYGQTHVSPPPANFCRCNYKLIQAPIQLFIRIGLIGMTMPVDKLTGVSWGLRVPAFSKNYFLHPLLEHSLQMVSITLGDMNSSVCL
jgi:hypothetical protein